MTIYTIYRGDRYIVPLSLDFGARWWVVNNTPQSFSVGK